VKKFKKPLLWTAGILLVAYIGLCLAYYFLQEKYLFTNTKPSSYNYQFNEKHEELTIQARDGKKLNGLLFKTDSAKGLLFYLHGGGHALDRWGTYAKTYTDLHYDIFFLDYRGFGKSEGDVPTEKELYQDVQDAYTDLKKLYPENAIVILGYSFGTAAAAKLASENHPKMLLLQAPYYSGEDAVRNNYPFLFAIIPSFLLKYKLKTYEFIKKVQSPIVIIHGNKDSTFNVSESYRLQKLLKPTDQLIVLDGQGHNNFTTNPDYINALKRILHPDL
jgi:pimeloyl-ACP methyl ester carboxylesterase